MIAVAAARGTLAHLCGAAPGMLQQGEIALGACCWVKRRHSGLVES